MSNLYSIAAGWTPDRLSALRAQMDAQSLDAFIIPRWDRNHFEYVPPESERLAWTTGFSGSWGLAIATRETIALFIDGRYTEQAARETDSERIERHHLYDDPPAAWMGRTARDGQRIGYDPDILTHDLKTEFEQALADTSAELVAAATNPVDQAWTDRPAPPTEHARPFPPDQAGETVASKLSRLAEKLESEQIDAWVETTPDNVNWLFNLRGLDLDYCPTVQARALIERDGHAHLFLAAEQIDPAADYEFRSNETPVTLHPPSAFHDEVEKRIRPGTKLGLDPRFGPVAFDTAAGKADARMDRRTSPVTDLKSIKNDAELSGMRDAGLRDSVIWIHFLHWIEQEVPRRDAASSPVTEREAENWIDGLRKAESDFTGSSFRTISAADGNAALAHYAAPDTNSAPIRTNSIYLHDSGAQFARSGTTDTTRTLCFSKAPDDIRTRYTLVLKGHINLARQIFPDGTFGHQLNALARMALWQNGLDYDHGTGHGVGHYLSVHEFPQRLQKTASPAPFRAGMTLTVEPGHYEADRYGIRIENLCEIVEDRPGFLRLEELAFIPIQTRMIRPDLLDAQDIAWLDDYHQRVWNLTSLRIDDDGVRDWLRQATRPLSQHQTDEQA